MDNLAHTLVGAALGMAGLKRKTGLGLATLMIAANLPDIDALGLLFGENLAWRRGWTHGPIALLVLPLLLAAAIVAFDRWQAQRGRRPTDRLPVRIGWVLALAYIGILSHPLLDFLNTYGIRCLMPFSDRWFYGDALFIIDLWIWIVLGIGIWLSRRRERRQQAGAGLPALTVLLLAACYSLAMGAAGRAAEHYAARDIAALGLGQPSRVLASPVPIDPFRRRILFEVEDAYGFGDFRWLPAPRITLEPGLIPTGMDDPVIALAVRQEKSVADFLYWSRYPFASVRRDADGAEVVIGDARYNRRPDDGGFSVRAVIPGTGPAPGQLPRGQASASPRE
ncbi:metal-dependent hydrolase [Sphingobium sp. D43FB]|uniref:metal-dependent hydrolase n=1 Tax=Sphingobium sp. D43FB TaxID=2017595 RepID=UPI000BB54411|nr:metal-dependent hydrolase [Sphingobium sp. D43FB]PBN42275.1 metal-dependent hydrolase [Sphingobium sp. D43FB]